MLKWIDVKRFANQGNPEPDRKLIKTDEEWRTLLSDEQYRITRLKGTERPFNNEMCTTFEPGIYACICCQTDLFDSTEKFDSGTGWPSFNQPLQPNVIAYHFDNKLPGRPRIEVTCNICDAHLGHVFPDGPDPSGLRYCINAVAIQKVEKTSETIIFGGGCFWCTEAMFKELDGVLSVASGYSGGHVRNPTYKEVCSGLTGHAEAIEVVFDPNKISRVDLLRIHMSSHDPTTLNRQGNDVGTQYRSVIFVNNDDDRALAEQVLKEANEAYGVTVSTTIEDFGFFYRAEDYHQDYFELNKQKNSYCSAVVGPKLSKFRQKFAHLLKTTEA